MYIENSQLTNFLKTIQSKFNQSKLNIYQISETKNESNTLHIILINNVIKKSNRNTII
jgi:hypothetical protein